MNRYRYNGPVLEFEKCVDSFWKAETIAVSEKKARSNFMHQYKKQNNRIPQTKVSLPGKIILVEEDVN